MDLSGLFWGVQGVAGAGVLGIRGMPLATGDVSNQNPPENAKLDPFKPPLLLRLVLSTWC